MKGNMRIKKIASLPEDILLFLGGVIVKCGYAIAYLLYGFDKDKMRSDQVKIDRYLDLVDRAKAIAKRN